jgi:hypothetical protein
MENTGEKSFFKRFWWIILIISILAILIIGGCAFFYVRYSIWMKMDPPLVSRAENALSAGIKINDGEDDFVIMGSNKEVPNENNPSPYKLSSLDIKSLELGMDESHLYYKVSFFDTIPKTPTAVGKDMIRSIGCKLEIVDQNGKDQEILAVDYGYLPKINIPSLNTYYFYGSTGIEEPESARFAHQDHDSKVFGGGGTNYILGAFPLTKLKIQQGQEIHLAFSMEARSDSYTHAAVDVLGGHSKMPAVIRWDTKTNKYERNDDFYRTEK